MSVSTVQHYQKQPPEVFHKKGFLKNSPKFTRKHLYQSLFFNKVAGFATLLKKALAQVFSCEFWKIFKNTFLTEHLLTMASVLFYYFSKAYSEPGQTSRMKLLAKVWQGSGCASTCLHILFKDFAIAKFGCSLTISVKNLHHRCFPGSE